MGRGLLITVFLLGLTACGGGTPEGEESPVREEQTPRAEVTPTGYINEELGFTWEPYPDWVVEEGEGEVAFTSPNNLYSLNVMVSPWGGEELRDLIEAYLATLQEIYPEARIAIPIFSQRLGGEQAVRVRFNYQTEERNQAHDLILV
ncbi:MAG: hypothetical protein HYX86_01035, partial [Chloroflexi bacterium]|nr:hypothetical protein [Chloroflexota bacterium]